MQSGYKARGRRSGMTAALTAVACCAFAGAASAHTDGASVATFSKLEIALDGRIPARCELGRGGRIDLGELTGGETATANLGFECNVPFELSFQSSRGGLAHDTAPNGQGPYAGTLGYSLDIRVPTLNPTPRALQASFNSRALTSRKSISSDGAIAAGGARLQLVTETPTGAGLLAGKYSETLTVTVTPRF